jgi:two-component system LytT family response regulator
MPDRIRVMIVDDEPIARRTLRLMLTPDAEIEVVDECDGRRAVEQIRLQRPDVVFLDIQMPGMDGFAVLERVGIEVIPAVVFVTAHDDYALRAFDVAAVDYLLKPFDDDRFSATVRRVKAAVRGRGANARAGPSPYLQRFLVRQGATLSLVPVGEVDWIEAADYYASLHVGARVHLLRQTMTELERRLDPTNFLREHRSCILTLGKVRAVVPVARGEYAAVLADGRQVRIGRGRVEELQRRLAGHATVKEDPGPERDDNR